MPEGGRGSWDRVSFRGTRCNSRKQRAMAAGAGAARTMLPVPGLRPWRGSGEHRAQTGSRVPRAGRVLAAGRAGEGAGGSCSRFFRPMLGLELWEYGGSACPPVLCECPHKPPATKAEVLNLI